MAGRDPEDHLIEDDLIENAVADDAAHPDVADTDEDPAPDMSEAERLATREGALVRGRYTLIGTVGTDAVRRALVLNRRGEVLQIHVGDVLAGARVDAIAPDRVLMSRGGRQQVLEMPQG